MYATRHLYYNMHVRYRAGIFSTVDSYLTVMHTSCVQEQFMLSQDWNAWLINKWLHGQVEGLFNTYHEKRSSRLTRRRQEKAKENSAPEEGREPVAASLEEASTPSENDTGYVRETRSRWTGAFQSAEQPGTSTLLLPQTLADLWSVMLQLACVRVGVFAMKAAALWHGDFSNRGLSCCGDYYSWR